MSTTIESLELEIQSNAGSAESGLNNLVATLERLKTATKGGVGLTSVVNQITKISEASKGVSQSSVNNLTGLANAISILSSAGNVKISSTIATQITAIGNSIRSLDGANFSPIAELGTALTPLSTIGNVNLGSIVNQLAKVPQVVTSMNGVDINGFASKLRELTTALQPLSEAPKSAIGSTITQLQKIPQLMTSLNGVDMGAFASKIQEVANAMRPLADEMLKVSQGFSAFPSKIQRLISSTNTLSATNKKASLSFASLYAKISMAVTAVRTVARVIGSAINEINNYIENVNLFTVSMGEYAKEAGEYAERVGDLMGIDPSEWMRNQGVFMTLATGFGVVNERAYVMSQQLTQLGYDISSFFNISYADAMQKLQSGLSGELEPLRRLGYDLSQAKLEAVALSLGINKAVSSMTQAEKAELRYYAIMTQVTSSHGDMARTLDAPANQLRIFKSQLTQCARAIGSIFIPMLNKILPYATAVVKVIRILAGHIATLFGFTLPEIDWDGGENATSNVVDNLEDSISAAKKLKSLTMGFDELNILSAGNDSDDSDFTGTGFDFELPTYDFLDGVTESKVNTIVEEMKEWLGITDDIDEWSDLLDTRLGDILETVGLIGGGFVAWKVTESFMNAITTLKTILNTPSHSIALGLAITITGLAIHWEGLKDAVNKGLDKFNFAEIVGGGAVGIGGAALLGSKIAAWITTAFEGSAVANALTTAASNLGVGTVGVVGGAIFAGVAAIIVGIPTYIVGIYDAIKNGLEWLNATLISIGATLAGAGIGAIIGACGGPIGAGIGALIGLAIGLITDFTIWMWQNFEKLEDWFLGMPAVLRLIVTKMVGMLTGSIFTIITLVIALIKHWDDIKAFWSTLADWFNEHLVEPMVNFTKGLFKRISEFAEGCWLIIRAIWEVASTFIYNEFIQPAIEIFKILWETASTFFSYLWRDIKAELEPTVKYINETFIQPAKEAFDLACQEIGEFFSTLWVNIKNGVASAMNAVIGAVESCINRVVRAINNLIGGFNKIVQWAADVLGEDWGGVSLIQEVKLDRLPVETITANVELDKKSTNLKKYNSYFTRFASGGFPEQGQMFIAREAGAELVGSIGRRTAVVNNDQIVESVSNGVAVANEEQNALLREQNSILKALLQKDNGITLDGKTLTKSVEKYQRERGATIYTGGVLNGI